MSLGVSLAFLLLALEVFQRNIAEQLLLRD